MKNKIENIVKGRPVFILSHGRSIQDLESYIEKFNQDICYISFSTFPIMEEFILSKINKKLDIVFDCATVPHARIEHYEIHTRFPRIEEFLKRKENNIWITTHGLIRDSVEPLRPDIYDNFKEKIVLVDNLFPPDEIPKWMDVPNSLTLIIACALAGGASKIIIFGLDGYSGDISKGVDSYYKKETVIKERQSALGSYIDAGINRDTKGFENRFPKILEQYRMLFGNNCEILNCSPSSYYTVLPKIKYSELEEVLNDAKSSNNK